MEYKDHSHNQLDEGLIGSIGRGAKAAGKTVGRGAMTAGKKVGSATMTAGKMGGGLAASIGRGAAKEYSPDNLAKKAVQALGGKEQATGRMDQGPPAKGYLGIPKKMMQALPTDDAGRFGAAKAAGSAVSRAIGGQSPGSMKGIFSGDPYSAQPRPAGGEAGEQLTPEQRAMARQIQQLTNVSYGEAIGQVLSMQQGIVRTGPSTSAASGAERSRSGSSTSAAPETSATKGSATLKGAGNRNPGMMANARARARARKMGA